MWTKPKLKTMPSRLVAIDTQRLKTPEKVALPFYSSPEWRSLMKEIIAERGRRCEVCGRTGTRIFGDHIKEIKDGGERLDKRNIVCKCGSCHTKKTLEARKDRALINYNEEPHEIPKNSVRADARATQPSLHDGRGGLHADDDSKRPRNFRDDLEKALQGRT